MKLIDEWSHCTLTVCAIDEIYLIGHGIVVVLSLFLPPQKVTHYVEKMQMVQNFKARL